MNDPLIIILDFVFRLATLLFLVRFLLQASNADFYNPVSQAVVKASDTVCKPLRIILRPYRQWDFASFVVAWLLSIAFVAVLTILIFSLTVNPLSLIISGLVRTLLVLVQFYWWTILILVIASFVSQGGQHPALTLIGQLVDPLIAPVRKVLPNFGPLDLSPMVVLMLLYVAQTFLVRMG
jgi:YggT family protein